MPLTLDELRKAIGEPTLDDEIRNVASLVSITLALLALFTNQRAQSLASQGQNLKPLRPRELRRDVVIDTALVVFSLAALTVMGPLARSAVSDLALVSRDGVLPGMFCLLYLGFTFVSLWELTIAWRRTGLLKTKTGRSRLGAIFGRLPA
jgi:hypothetical protein